MAKFEIRPQLMWLIAGGSGQLGKALSQVLAERNIEYFCPSSSELDIRSEEQCEVLLSELKPEVVINAAAWTNVDLAESEEEGAYAVNAIGALNLAKASKSVGAVLAYISTDYVFSGDAAAPYEIDSPREPISAYGRTKAAGEKFVLTEYPEASYIFRTAWLYSRSSKNFVRTIIDLEQSSNEEIKVVNDQVGQPTYALDLANQITDSILGRIPKGIYHATNSGEASWFDFASEIFRILGKDAARLIPISSRELPRPAKRPKNSVLSHKCWNEKSIPPMGDWKISLRESLVGS